GGLSMSPYDLTNVNGVPYPSDAHGTHDPSLLVGLRRLRSLHDNGVSFEQSLVESLLGVLPLDVGPLAADRIAHLLQRWHASLCTGADAHQMHTVPRGHWPLPLTEGKFSQGRGKRLTKQFHNLTARQRLELVVQQKGIAQHRDLRLVASLAQRGEKLRG